MIKTAETFQQRWQKYWAMDPEDRDIYDVIWLWTGWC